MLATMRTVPSTSLAPCGSVVRVNLHLYSLITENGSSRIDVTIDATTKLEVSELPNRLIAQGFRITSMQGEQVNLETAFMRLTKGLVG